jgi:hypothetical protein
MTLEECAGNIGRKVAYSMCGDCDWAETGVIVRTGATFAYVRFGSLTPKACLPADLTLAEPEQAVTP